MTVKISELPSLTTPAVEDEFPMLDVSANVTKQVTAQRLIDLITANQIYADNVFRISGSVDGTKKLALEVDGITTSTTRTWTVQDRSGTVALIGDAVPNPVINGSMEIWQRGTTFAAAGNPQYGADRFAWRQSGAGVVTLNRSTNVPSVASAGVLFNYSFEVDVTTADASIGATDLYQVDTRIEGYNWRYFAQRAIVINFWVSSSKTGTHCVFLGNSGANRCYIAEYTISSADTWEFKTVTITASPSAGTWNYTNGVGLDLGWTLAVGSSGQVAAGSWQTTASQMYGSSNQVNVLDSTANFFRLTGVTLELVGGNTTTYFRPFQLELACCTRYYQKSFNYATAPAQNAGLNTGEHRFNPSVAGAVASTYAITLPTPMRVAPTTITTYNPSASNVEVRNITDSADFTTTSIAATGERGLLITSTGTAGTALGESLGIHWSAEAEI